MGWWTDPVGSKKSAPAKRAAPAKSPSGRGRVVATTKRGGNNPARCPICRKTSGCTCGQTSEVIPTRRGAPKGDRRDNNNVIWCGCGARVNPINGVCMDVTCSSRRSS